MDPLCRQRHLSKTSCDHMDPIRKTSRFAYGPLINPPPSLSKISYKYNSILTYIPVSFLFSFKKGFGLGLKIGDYGEFRLGLGFWFGIGNLISGAVGTVDPCGRKTAVFCEMCVVVYMFGFLKKSRKVR